MKTGKELLKQAMDSGNFIITPWMNDDMFLIKSKDTQIISSAGLEWNYPNQLKTILRSK